MIEGISPVYQALLGTLFTWGLTALGAAVAIFIQGNQVRNVLFLLFISFSDRYHNELKRGKKVHFSRTMQSLRSMSF